VLLNAWCESPTRKAPISFLIPFLFSPIKLVGGLTLTIMTGKGENERSYVMPIRHFINCSIFDEFDTRASLVEWDCDD
jgi:hypothetical protein